MRELRIGIGHPGQRGVVNLRRKTEQRIADDDTRVIAGDVGKLRPARDVADRIDTRIARAKTRINLDTLCVEGDARLFEVKPFKTRTPSCGYEKMCSANRLARFAERNFDLLAVMRHPGNPRALAYDHAFCG